MNFVKQGNGKKCIVFLHGWGGCWQSWNPIIESLKNEYTIYALDLPGFGLTTLSRPYTLSDYTLELLNFINFNNVKNITLVGHSFGGQVAAKFTLDYPEKISKLVLVDSATQRNNSLFLKFNILMAKFGKKLGLGFLKNNYYKIRGWENSDYLKAKNTPFLQETAGKIFRENLDSELSKIVVPTLIFWGEKDQDTPISSAKIINLKIKNSKLVIIPNGGHFSYLDDQEFFCKELINFV